MTATERKELEDLKAELESVRVALESERLSKKNIGALLAEAKAEESRLRADWNTLTTMRVESIQRVHAAADVEVKEIHEFFQPELDRLSLRGKDFGIDLTVKTKKSPSFQNGNSNGHNGKGTGWRFTYDVLTSTASVTKSEPEIAVDVVTDGLATQGEIAKRLYLAVRQAQPGFIFDENGFLKVGRAQFSALGIAK